VKTRAALVTLVSLLTVGCSASAPSPQASPPPTPSQPEPAAKQEPPVAPANDNVASDDPWAQPAGKKDPIARPFFWSLEKAGKTSYALGTIHMGVDAELRLPQLVWDKLDASKTFAMEMDTGDIGVTGMGSRSKGTLEGDLGPEYWEKFKKLVGPQVAAGLNKMKPMIAATMLSMRGLPMTPPMDGVLHGRALNQKKALVYFETAGKQAALLEKYMDVKMLKMMIDDGDKAIEQTKEMLDAYLAGDDVKMIALSESQRADSIKAGYSAKEYDTFMNEILFKRNADWIPAIEKLHAAGGGFIAVGAAHLIGKKSVIEMLEKKGYKATRLP
jgi:uncharacterized protein YbaP (TraB family)